MRYPIPALAAVALLFAAVPARADLPVTLSLSTGAQVFTHRSHDFVDDDDHMQTTRLGAGYALGAPGGALELELAWSSAQSSEYVHGSNSQAELWLRGFDLGATYRLALARLFQPFARVAALYDWATLSVDGTSLIEQRVAHFGLAAMAGFSVPIIATQRWDESRYYPSLSLDFGLGYVWRSDYKFDALKPDASAGDGLREVRVNMGAMPMSAIQYRIGVGGRF